ncbi:hypothetical protein [Ammoniphilus sp. CFH 90114]|uniref:hypothetical protein n=1 Tax=Ammoniphilus sp. CFH 90114 TaxID=2493665 RepID=UPI00100EA53B|nr:hypothetical protein [Ammoniphilus sp. CFH 90114]RXT07159.1 hypothetical protein EIZ39_13520 [Ammoniphilus sp. CFH 90114]
MLQQAIWLAKKEIKHHRILLLFTLFGTMFFALITSVLLDKSAKKMFGTEMVQYNHILLDIIFVNITVYLGTIFISGPYLSFRAIKEDPFSKRMAMLRSLPIPVPVLSLSRTLMMLITLVVMSITFYSTLAVALPEGFYQLISPVEFMVFIVFWFGCSLAIGGLNPYIEYGTSGKVLHLTPFLFLGILAITITTSYKVFDLGIVELILVGVKSNGWSLALLSLLIGVTACTGWNKILTHRLMKRDYY